MRRLKLRKISLKVLQKILPQPTEIEPVVLCSLSSHAASEPSAVVVYVVRSGPKGGESDLEAAFQTKSDAVEFLVKLHGLNAQETRSLSRELSLSLRRDWHGSDRCEICPEIMDSQRASQALSGALYLAA